MKHTVIGFNNKKEQFHLKLEGPNEAFVLDESQKKRWETILNEIGEEYDFYWPQTAKIVRAGELNEREWWELPPEAREAAPDDYILIPGTEP
ncbi:MAG TPA: hypothetical protein PK188_04455, partial [Thermosynergistes sp.]|nr:hypothetical protein [Thermosynergistes sp.]